MVYYCIIVHNTVGFVKEKGMKQTVAASRTIWALLGIVITVFSANTCLTAAPGASTVDVELCDTTPEPGKPLSQVISVHSIHPDHRNLPRTAGLLKVDIREISPTVREYTLTPAKAMRFIVMPILRVEGWRMVDRQAVQMDFSNCTKLRPVTLRCTVKTGKRGPTSVGNTTLLVTDAGVLQVKLTTKRPANIFRPGSPCQYALAITSDHDASPAITASTLDWQGNRTQLDSWQQKFSTKTPKTAKSPAERTIRFTPKLGFHRVLIDIKGYGQAYLDGGVLPQPPTDNNRIGINVTWSDHYTHSAEFSEDAAELLAMQGVRLVRTEFEWRMLEFRRGKYDWRWFDEYKKVCQAHNMKMIPTTFRIPRWASPSTNPQDFTHWMMKKEYFEDYFNYIEAIARRYKGWLKYMSVWNEIDSSWFRTGTAADYAAILKGSHKRIRAVDPSIIITPSGFAYTGKGTGADFFRGVLAAGGANYFDVLDIHYSGTDKVATFRADMKKMTGKTMPLWITEHAGNTVPNRSMLGATVQAEGRFKALISALAANPRKLLAWGDIDAHPTMNIWGNIKAEDRTPRPAFFVFGTFIRLFHDRSCTKIYSENADMHAYRFSVKGKDDIIVMWASAESSAVVEGLASSVTKVDLMGNRAKLNTRNGKLIVQLSPSPVCFVTSKKPSAVRPLAKFKRQLVAARPGKRLVIPLLLHNPTKQPKRVTIALKTPPTISRADKNTEVTVPAGKQISVLLAIAPSIDAPVGETLAIIATATGLTETPAVAALQLQVQTKEGTTLIWAADAPRTQGPCPGAPGHISGNSIAMFWGGAWMEYDIPFAEAGKYRLGVNANSRTSGHVDEVKGTVVLHIMVDGERQAVLDYTKPGVRTEKAIINISKPGTHTIKVLFPKDTGDVFVNFLTVEKAAK